MDKPLLQQMKKDFEERLKKAQAELIVAKQNGNPLEIIMIESDIARLQNLINTAPV